jgi:hypothetical protein
MSRAHPASTSRELASDVFPPDLRQYRGCWLAYSADGRRFIASRRTLKELEAQLRAAGENLEEVLLDHLPEGDAILSGAELI